MRWWHQLEVLRISETNLSPSPLLTSILHLSRYTRHAWAAIDTKSITNFALPPIRTWPGAGSHPWSLSELDRQTSKVGIASGDGILVERLDEVKTEKWTTRNVLQSQLFLWENSETATSKMFGLREEKPTQTSRRWWLRVPVGKECPLSLVPNRFEKTGWTGPQRKTSTVRSGTFPGTVLSHYGKSEIPTSAEKAAHYWTSPACWRCGVIACRERWTTGLSLEIR